MAAENELIGKKIEILLYNRDKLKEDEIYVSQFEEVLQENIYKVSMPMVKGELIPLHINQKIKVVYYSNTGIFGFDALVIDRQKSSMPMIIIQQVSEKEKIQRRQYYRHTCILPFRFKPLIEPELNNGFIKDISGGGICFICDKLLEPKSIVVCNLDLNEDKLSCLGEVLRTRKLIDNRYKYEVHVKFTKIKDLDKEKIIKYVFEEQRKLHRKQKGLI